MKKRSSPFRSPEATADKLGPLVLSGVTALLVATPLLPSEGPPTFVYGVPFVLLWLMWKLGYDRRAIVAQTVFAWVLLPVCYFFTSPADNVNWVFGVWAASS